MSDLDHRQESTGNSFRIFPDWKDVMVYDEGNGRVLRLDCGSQGDVFQVSVPDAQSWILQTPEWAHDRRPLILGRLRAAGCVVHETGSGREGRPSLTQWPVRPANLTLMNGVRVPQKFPIGSIFYLLASLVFVAGGVWQALDGLNFKDRLLGGVCVIFFGLAAVVPMLELLKWSRNRN